MSRIVDMGPKIRFEAEACVVVAEITPSKEVWMFVYNDSNLP